MIRRILLSLTIIPALVAGMMVSVVSAQESPAPGRESFDGEIPSVAIRPVGTTQSDPNGGQWFVTNMNPGEAKKFKVELYNPAEVGQLVRLYVADMVFGSNGVPQVAERSQDIGRWGGYEGSAFENSNIELKPGETRIETLALNAPSDADPGDHIGAVVAQHQPYGKGNIQGVKRVAVRLYATLPGDARKEFEINEVSAEKDSAFFTRELLVSVRLNNTGRIRLLPTVKVDEATAKGPDILVSQAIERYQVTRPVKIWGGPVRLTVNASTEAPGVNGNANGPTREMRVTVWVIPWHLFFALGAIAALVWFGRRLLGRRKARVEALQADLRRIERLITKEENVEKVIGAVEHSDARTAIKAAIKQARRTGDFQTVERLERNLDGPSETDEDAADDVMNASRPVATVAAPAGGDPEIEFEGPGSDESDAPEEPALDELERGEPVPFEETPAPVEPSAEERANSAQPNGEKKKDRPKRTSVYSSIATLDQHHEDPSADE